MNLTKLRHKFEVCNKFEVSTVKYPLPPLMSKNVSAVELLTAGTGSESDGTRGGKRSRLIKNGRGGCSHVDLTREEGTTATCGGWASVSECNCNISCWG